MQDIIETALGRYVFTNAEDYIAKVLREQGSWELHLCTAILDVLSKEKIRGADVGANVGLFSVQMALLAAQRGKSIEIDAFEVQKGVFANLQQNIELNSLQGIVRAHNFAIGKEFGTLEVDDVSQLDQSNAGAFSLREDVRENFGMQISDGAKVTVPVVPIASGYDFIKMDVEGMELEIIKGAEPLLRRERPAIIVEAWGAEKAPWFQAEAAEMFALMRDIYPKEYRMGENTLFWPD